MRRSRKASICVTVISAIHCHNVSCTLFSGETMQPNWYDRHILPYLLDLSCGLKIVAELREKVVPQAYGNVLEIGMGTGLNISHYDQSRVIKVTGVDPSLQLHRLAQRRIQRAGVEVDLIGLSAERLPIDDAQFDSAVTTFTLCTIPDPVAALREVRRVLKPGGKLFFLEHGRAPDAAVRRWQDRLQPCWNPIAGGCQLGRDIPALLREAGFIPSELQQEYQSGPKFMAYMYWGVASADASAMPKSQR